MAIVRLCTEKPGNTLSKRLQQVMPSGKEVLEQHSQCVTAAWRSSQNNWCF